MKKRVQSSSQQLYVLPSKIILSLFVILCIFTIFKCWFQELYQFTSDNISLSNSRDNFFDGNPKISFLFLARLHLPLDFLWDCFFRNAEEGSFSIYIHSKPGFVFNESTTRSRFFHGRQINNSVQVRWGGASMIEAEKLLLKAALQDPLNQRFILMSDSCVPLYNFSYIYQYVMSSPKSFVDSFVDVKSRRYNTKMLPIISKQKWRKGSQWFALIKKHAEIVIADNSIFSVVKKHCQYKEFQKERDCIPDEHYIQTLFAIKRLDGEIEQRTLTYTLWNRSAADSKKQNWHPFTFIYPTASPRHIQQIKDINHIYYATEHRTEWCQSNSTFVPCFLFARKFSLGAAMRLIGDGSMCQFDATVLLNE